MLWAGGLDPLTLTDQLLPAVGLTDFTRLHTDSSRDNGGQPNHQIAITMSLYYSQPWFAPGPTTLTAAAQRNDTLRHLLTTDWFPVSPCSATEYHCRYVRYVADNVASPQSRYIRGPGPLSMWLLFERIGRGGGNTGWFFCSYWDRRNLSVLVSLLLPSRTLMSMYNSVNWCKILHIE